MAMKVLLRRSIEGVGTVGETVRVKNGYARNYLLPQGYAAIVSPESLRRIAEDKKVEAVREAELAKERASLAERLAEVKLTIEVRASEEGHLFGSVGVRQVIASFLEQDFRFIERHVHFDTVRELGEYDVKVNLGADQEVTVPVWIVQDAAEAISMAEDAARHAEEEAARAEAESEEGVAAPSEDLLDAE
jgi:large subunit ribosomal protein L9